MEYHAGGGGERMGDLVDQLIRHGLQPPYVRTPPPPSQLNHTNFCQTLMKYYGKNRDEFNSLLNI